MKRRVYTPRPYAELASDHFFNVPRNALWAKPGMGKTIMTLDYVDTAIRVFGESDPTLVLAPLRVARDTWATEADKWEHLKGMQIVPIIGNIDQRTAALRHVGNAPVFTINYDNIVWLVEHYEQKGRRWPFRRVVADEATKLKGFRVKQGTQRAKALGRVAHKLADYFTELTGTPSPNGLKDLWGQLWFLDEGAALGLSYQAFEERYFAYRSVRDAISNKPSIVPFILPGSDRIIHEKIKHLCLTLDPADWFDLEEPVVNHIPVQLPARTRQMYRELERDMFTRLNETAEVEVFNAAALSNKCQQLANGGAYIDKDQWIQVHFEKLDALEELGEETGTAPLLVSYEYRFDLEMLLRRFPDALDLSRADHMELAMAGHGKYWLGHPASMGHGVDGLQKFCSDVVFFGQTWNLEHHDQIIERVGPMRQLQEGTGKRTFIHYIYADDTVDVAVMARRDGKRSVQDTLLAYMKGKL